MAQVKTPTVLFLASWYPTPINKSHGIFIKNHAVALSKFVNVVVVYAFSSQYVNNFTLQTNAINQNFTEYIIEFKKVNSTIPIVSQFKKWLRLKKAYKLLLQTLINNKINITAIQLNVVFPAAINLSIFKNYYKVKHTIVEHWSGYLPEDGNYKGFLIKHYTKQAFKQVSKIFYVSLMQKHAMQMQGLQGNYELLYNVVNTDVFFYTKNLKNKVPTFLHVSTLDYDQKNISGTLNSLKKLQQNGFIFNSIFVGGDEPKKKHFEHYAQQLNITNINFVGNKTQAQIAQLMQQAHALILFSNYENMPVVVLEALASGLPIFASKVGQLPFIVNKKFGVLVDIGNNEQLTNQLQLFLQGKLEFDSEKMVEFIANNAAFDVVGKKLANEYLM